LRHKVADLDGPVHYIDFGGEGKPLLMVHGLGGNALNWMAVGPELAKRYHAFAMDLAGFGQTPLFHRAATVGANTALVNEFIQKVIGEPVVLMGNSMGGHITILEAGDHPRWVTECILVDPAVPGMQLRRPDPAMLGIAAAISIPGLAELVLERSPWPWCAPTHRGCRPTSWRPTCSSHESAATLARRTAEPFSRPRVRSR
jgi:pimeloyl-ACP methyl ester carboxylesterase